MASKPVPQWHSSPYSTPAYPNPPATQLAMHVAGVLSSKMDTLSFSMTRLPSSTAHALTSNHPSGSVSTAAGPVYNSIAHDPPHVWRASPAHGMLHCAGSMSSGVPGRKPVPQWHSLPYSTPAKAYPPAAQCAMQAAGVLSASNVITSL